MSFEYHSESLKYTMDDDHNFFIIDLIKDRYGFFHRWKSSMSKKYEIKKNQISMPFQDETTLVPTAINIANADLSPYAKKSLNRLLENKIIYDDGIKNIVDKVTTKETIWATHGLSGDFSLLLLPNKTILDSRKLLFYYLDKNFNLKIKPEIYKQFLNEVTIELRETYIYVHQFFDCLNEQYISSFKFDPKEPYKCINFSIHKGKVGN